MRNSSPRAMGWYLAYFMHRHLDFRRQELQALADLHGCGDTVKWRKPFGDIEHSPLWYVWLPSDELASKIAERSILTKALIELWGEGDSDATLNESIDGDDALVPRSTRDAFLAEGTTFKVVNEDFGFRERGTASDPFGPVRRRMDALAPAVTFKGKARMKGAQNLFWHVETANAADVRGLPTDIPRRKYFGRVVGLGDGRAAINKYDLTKRRYLGPTSMDVEMGLIMCNMVHARPGGVVWDPFCGTGSILVSAAHFGAMTFGTDIDIRVIKFGKKDKKTGAQVDVWSNFDDYGLPKPIGLLRMDLHKHSFTSKKHVEGFLQGVVGDPPYGVRAGGRKSGGRKRLADGTVPPVPEKFKSDHIPSTVPYPFSECMDDLMDNAARLLAVGGRLAFFMPCAADAEDAKTAGADETPSHPMLALVARSDQMLSTRWGRRLVTFRKVKPYDAREAEEARALLNAARKKNGGVEDLLQRMREVVYHGERAAEKKKREEAKAAKTRARGAVVKDPRGPREDLDLPGGRDATTRDDAEDVEEKNASPFASSDAVAARHKAHSASGEKMEPAKRAPFRGKCT